MNIDVFISHSSKDANIANAICNTLEANNIRCWIAPRDIRPGSDWAESITDAIENSKVMVLVFSENSNNSTQVAKELNLAINNKLIVLPFKIDDTNPTGSMKYYLSDTHWLDAINGDIKDEINKLKDVLLSLLPQSISLINNNEEIAVNEADEAEKPKKSKNEGNQTKEKFLEKYRLDRKIPLFVICGIIVIGMLTLFGSRLNNKNNSSSTIELINAYASEIKFIAENGEEIINGYQIISIEPSYLEESGYGLMLELSTDGIDAFTDVSQRFIGQVISVYINDELIFAPAITAPIDANPIVLSLDSEEEFDNVIDKLGIANKKTVSSIAVARDFGIVNDIVESIKADETRYQVLSSEVDVLVDILTNHQDDIKNTSIDEVNDYEVYSNNMHPAWDKLSLAMYNVDKEAEKDEVQTETQSEESVTPKSSTTKKPTTQTQQKSVQQQPVQQQPIQQQPAQEQSAQQQTTNCAVCGSKYHSVHPTADAPTIDKDFD